MRHWQNIGHKPRVKAIILDIIHAAEYLWKAANALHGETGPERLRWMNHKLHDLLQSKVGRIIGSLKQILTKKDLPEATRRRPEKVITYFENHRHMMDYKTYLDQGYLISTGIVESACGSLVKDRMEQSGMRWTIKGAKAILDLRAVKKMAIGMPFGTVSSKRNRKKCIPTIITARHIRTKRPLSCTPEMGHTQIILPFPFGGFLNLIYSQILNSDSNVEEQSVIQEESCCWDNLLFIKKDSLRQAQDVAF